MNAQSYGVTMLSLGALPPTKDYIYEESKDEVKDKAKTTKSADSYHTLPGSRDFELQKMPKGNDTVKANSKAAPSTSYHRLGSEPSKPTKQQVYNPLASNEDDNKPVKLVSKEKAKTKSEKK